MKGSIVKRENTYSIIYDLDKDMNGKRKQKWDSGYKTKKEAQIALNKKIYEVENDNYFESCNITLQEYLRDWFIKHVEKNLAINTASGYKINIEKHILPDIGKVPLSKLQPLHIQKLYNDKINSGLSPTTVIYIHRVLHKALQQAVKMQIINKNITDFIELPKKNHFDIKVYNEIQIKALLEAVKGTILYLPILLAVSLGLRRGEVLGLVWDDVDFEYNVVNISRTQVNQDGKVIYAQTKTIKSKRSILVSDNILELLKEQKALQENNKALLQEAYFDDNLINCHNDGSPITACSLNKAFRRVLEKNNFTVIRFHDLRHTNATLMLKNKIPAKIVSERLGHSNIGITLDLYSHVANDMQKEASFVLDNFIF